MTLFTTHLPRLATAAAAFAVVVSLGLGASAFAADKTANLTKQDVEKIVEEYLMNNGKVIMDSVDAYQRKAVNERSAEGIKNNRDALFNDKDAPFLGNEKGDVVVVEFFDYNCGYCKRVLPEVQKLVEGDKNVKVVFIDFPILGPTSETAARWAMAAHKQDKYFEFHRRLMEHQGQISDDALRDVAKEAGLDVDAAAKIIDSSEITMHIEKNRKLGQDVGVNGTPAFVIDDQLFPGAVPLEQLKAAVDAQRAKAD
jgi:protein-disulfide isomerase